MEWIRNKRVLITGPTSGIGRQIAIDLGSLGAHVILACRNRARGQQVAHAIASTSTAAGVDVVHVDVSSRQSVETFIGEYVASHPPIDVLINNAGTIQGERRESVDGIELTFATNVLGYHRVTCGLLDHFNTASPARIVVERRHLPEISTSRISNSGDDRTTAWLPTASRRRAIGCGAGRSPGDCNRAASP